MGSSLSHICRQIIGSRVARGWIDNPSFLCPFLWVGGKNEFDPTSFNGLEG